jgi:ribosome biogenesis protein BMS1
LAEHAQVGKTTLIRSLVRRYTKTTMPDIKGPVTVVSGKTRRLTFLECPNDIGAMVDVAKVADLVLVMIDGSFGFEMVRARAQVLVRVVSSSHRKHSRP